MAITYRDDIDGIDWNELKVLLAGDNFDNGRTPEQLRTSFENSRGICIAWAGGQVVGTSRVLSDGVCNAYLVDVWTLTHFRRQGIAREMIARLCRNLAGQHLYLQADSDIADFYRRIGFEEQPVGMSRVIGEWLVNHPHG